MPFFSACTFALPDWWRIELNNQIVKHLET
jgi:hypothetical protein